MNNVKGLILKGYCRVSAAKAALKNRTADENVSKVTWIVAAFLVAAVVIGFIVAAYNGTVRAWFNTTVGSWFPAAGEARPAVPTS